MTGATGKTGSAVVESAKLRVQRLFENRNQPPLVVMTLGAVMGRISWVTPAVQVESGSRYATGGGLVLLGLLLFSLGFGAFGRARTTIDPVNLGRMSKLVTGGVFHYSRNPM